MNLFVSHKVHGLFCDFTKVKNGTFVTSFHYSTKCIPFVTLWKLKNSHKILFLEN